jgi:hypothetical protein
MHRHCSCQSDVACTVLQGMFVTTIHFGIEVGWNVFCSSYLCYMRKSILYFHTII